MHRSDYDHISAGAASLPKARRLLRPRRVAELLNCSISMVYKLVANEHLKAFQLGRELRIREISVDEYLAKNERTPCPTTNPRS